MMFDLAMMGMPGHTEIMVIVLIVLLLFGSKKLPELSRSIGKSLGEFKKGHREGNQPDEAKISGSQVDDKMDTAY